MDLMAKTFSGKEECRRMIPSFIDMWVKHFNSEPFNNNTTVISAFSDIRSTLDSDDAFLVAAYDGDDLVFIEGGKSWDLETSSKFGLKKCADVSFAISYPGKQNKGYQTFLRGTVFDFLRDKGYENLLVLIPDTIKPDGEPLGKHFEKVGYKHLSSYVNPHNGKKFNYYVKKLT